MISRLVSKNPRAALLLCALWGAAMALQAGGELSGQPAPAVPEAAPAPAPIGALPVPYYNEAFCYSSYARRSYVPGYTPHPSTLYENPRTYPEALCVIATPYHQYASIPGWFFGSPMGYLSSVPPGSHVLAYERGELGITQKTVHGYPQGLRVVEPIVMPMSGHCRNGGILILGETPPIAIATPLPAAGASSAQNTDQTPKQREK